MAGSSTSGIASSPNLSAPKILLAKPSAGPVTGKFGRGGNDDETAQHRSRLPPVGSLNLLSDSWDFHIDRFLPFLTENTDFLVIGVIGPPGVGKSTIMNELYGFDGASPGMLPPFSIQSEETRAMGRHCTVGIEPRVSAERIILLDTQSVYSPSVLAEMMRPDGSSTVSALSGDPLSAELAHEIMNIQLGVLLSSICHILLVVSEGVHDNSMWDLMLTVDLLKHGIPDPSLITLPHTAGTLKEARDKVLEDKEYMAMPVFVHTKMQDGDLTPSNVSKLRKALAQYLSSASFTRGKHGTEVTNSCGMPQTDAADTTPMNLLAIPSKVQDDPPRDWHDSYLTALWQLRDKALSMDCPSFGRSVSERDWLKSSAKIWELVKSSPVIAEYGRTLVSCGIFRR